MEILSHFLFLFLAGGTVLTPTPGAAPPLNPMNPTVSGAAAFAQPVAAGLYPYAAASATAAAAATAPGAISAAAISQPHVIAPGNTTTSASVGTLQHSMTAMTHLPQRAGPYSPYQPIVYWYPSPPVSPQSTYYMHATGPSTVVMKGLPFTAQVHDILSFLEGIYEVRDQSLGRSRLRGSLGKLSSPTNCLGGRGVLGWSLCWKWPWRSYLGGIWKVVCEYMFDVSVCATGCLLLLSATRWCQISKSSVALMVDQMERLTLPLDLALRQSEPLLSAIENWLAIALWSCTWLELCDTHAYTHTHAHTHTFPDCIASTSVCELEMNEHGYAPGQCLDGAVRTMSRSCTSKLWGWAFLLLQLTVSRVSDPKSKSLQLQQKKSVMKRRYLPEDSSTTAWSVNMWDTVAKASFHSWHLPSKITFAKSGMTLFLGVSCSVIATMMFTAVLHKECEREKSLSVFIFITEVISWCATEWSCSNQFVTWSIWYSPICLIFCCPCIF